MKRLSCLTLLGASMFMFSCGDDAPSAAPHDYSIPNKFSSNSIAENKTQLEDNGIKLLKNLEGLKDLKAIDATVSLAGLLGTTGGSDAGWEEAAPGGRILSSLSNTKDAKSASRVFSAMRLSSSASSEEPRSIQEVYDALVGTYAWNSNTEEWDTLAGGSSIIFKFPAVEGSGSNNAILTIGNYQGIDVNFTDYQGGLPTNLTMDLKVDGAKVMDYSFKASYNNSKDPVSLETSLSLEAYVFNISFSNTTTEVKADYSLKKGSAILIAMGGSSTGKYSIDAIENSADSEDIVDKGSAFFQVQNIRIAGTVDAKSIAAGMDVIYPDGYWNNQNFDYEAATEKEANLYNENYKLVVFYADSKEKIADTEFYAYPKTETYSYWVDTDGDGYGDTEESYSSTYHVTEMRLVFADGTKSDFGTYFSTGFSNLEAEMDNFIGGF